MSGTGPPDEPFDPGLQPERTLLAWRRTCLAVALAFAAAIRFVTPLAGPLVVPLGLAGIGLAAATWVLAARRYRVAHTALVAGRPLPRAPGMLVTMLAAVALLQVGGVAFVLARAGV